MPPTVVIRVTTTLRAAPLRTVFLAAALVWAGGCKREAQGQAGGPPAAVPVTVGTAVKADVPTTVEAIATAKAFSSVTIRPRVGGVAISKHFTPGQRVAKGDLLYKLDPKPYEIALAKARAELARGEALAARARVVADRKKEILASNAASRFEVQEAEAEAKSLEAQADADRAVVDQAQLDLEYCTITSPIDGFVGPTLTDAGSIVKANETDLVVVRQVQPIYVEMSAPQTYLDAIQEAMRKGEVGVEVTVPGKGGAVERGVLLFVNNTVTEETGTITMRGLFANEQTRLWPGRYLHGSITLGVERDVVLVPNQAVQLGQDGTYVFVVKEDQTAEMQAVSIGRELGERTVVTSGLEAGATVVTDGHLRLRPGGKVQVLADPTEPAPPRAEVAAP